jgi:hypothetical protein
VVLRGTFFCMTLSISSSSNVHNISIEFTELLLWGSLARSWTSAWKQLVLILPFIRLLRRLRRLQICL